MATTEVASNGGAAGRDVNHDVDYDVVIIGAGIAGIHQLYALQGRGLSVRVFEAGTGVGGTWYWNRYPMARFDSESYSYGYFFSQGAARGVGVVGALRRPARDRALPELRRRPLRPPRPHPVRAPGWSRSSSTRPPPAGRCTPSDGATHHGPLRDRRPRACCRLPFFPDIPGRDRFQGESYHTGLWPKEPVDFTGKRVAMIGTGASAVQLLPAIADEVGSITVYQRTPNWNAPLNNGQITAEEQAEIKAS